MRARTIGVVATGVVIGLPFLLLDGAAPEARLPRGTTRRAPGIAPAPARESALAGIESKAGAPKHGATRRATELGALTAVEADGIGDTTSLSTAPASMTAASMTWATPPEFPQSDQPSFLSWSDLPTTNPDLVAPDAAAQVPTGQSYADTVPDTLDLATMAQLYIQGITATLEPSFYYAPPGHVDMAAGQIEIPGGVENWGKSIEAMVMARRISGYDLDNHDGTLAIQQQSLHNMCDPAVNLAILNGASGTSDGCWIVYPSANFTPQTVAVESLMELYKQSPTAELRTTIQQMIDYQSVNSVPIVENGESMLYRSDTLPLPDPSQQASLAPAPNGWCNYPFIYGKAARALSTWADLTGDPQAFQSALGYTNFMVDHDNQMFWQMLPGSSIPAGTAHFSGHVHSFLNGLMGIAWTAETLLRANPNDPRAPQLVSFANAGYLFVRDEYGWSALGNFGEICGTGDMLRLATKLTDLGGGDYYDDVDRWLRNQITEAQILDTSMIPDAPNSNPLLDHVGSRVHGLFYEDAAHPFAIPTNSPNGANPFQLVACGLGNVMMGVSDAWDHIVQYKGSFAQVNLLLNRASTYLDVKSQLPYAGQVDIVTKSSLGPLNAMGVRIPDWADKSQVQVYANGQSLAGQFLWVAGNYVQVNGLAPNTDYTITFPIVIRQLPIQQMKNQGEMWTESNMDVDASPESYTGTFRGNTLVDVDHRPSGGAQLYQRQALAALPGSDVPAPTKSVTRFVADAPQGSPPANIFLRQQSTGNLQIVLLGGYPLGVTGVQQAGGMGMEWVLNEGLDWNGDGIPDLFGHDLATGELLVLYGDGNGGWSGSQTLGSIGAEWKLQVARFRRQGGVDIFGHDQQTGTIEVWHTDGTKIVSSSIMGQIGPEWDLSLGDFDGDGILDIVGVDTRTGDLHVWFTDGNTCDRGDKSIGQIGLEWTLSLADMNGDGLVDIFGRDTSGNLYVWNNVAGDHVDGGSSWGNISLDWELQLTDLNGDGFVDVFGRSLSTGQLMGWYSDGHSLRSTSNLGQVGPHWIAQAGGSVLR